MLQSLRSNRLAFRTIAIFMCLVLVMPTFAAGAPEASKSLISIWRRLTNELPPKFSHSPRPRPVRANLDRDKDRNKWWTQQVREAYDDALIAAHGEPESLSWRIVASLNPSQPFRGAVAPPLATPYRAKVRSQAAEVRRTMTLAYKEL